MRRGLLAEFESATACSQAILSLKREGFVRLDAYMPYPAKEIQEALGAPASPLPRYVFAAGLCGALLGYFILWYTNVHDYPLDVAGYPSHAVAAFIPITFETLVLFAGCTAFLGALLLGGMPRLYDPIDTVEGTERIAVDCFVLAVDADDDSFDVTKARSVLTASGAGALRELGDVTSFEARREEQP